MAVEHRRQNAIQHLLGLLIVKAAGQARQRFDAAVFPLTSDRVQRFSNACLLRLRDRRLPVGVTNFDAQRAADLEPFTPQRNIEITEICRNSLAFRNGDQRFASGQPTVQRNRLIERDKIAQNSNVQLIVRRRWLRK